MQGGAGDGYHRQGADELGSPAWRAAPLGSAGWARRPAGGVSSPPPACARRWPRASSRRTSQPRPAARTPAPAPRVVLTADDRELWAPGPPVRSVVPVLLYHGVAPVSGFSKRADADLGIDPDTFARQMVLLDQAGYETITLDEFVQFTRRKGVSLPPAAAADLRRRARSTPGPGAMRSCANWASKPCSSSMSGA